MLKKNIWIPIESNPDSMFLYSCKLGQSKLKFLDIYGFHKELLDMIPKPVHAIIFLYPLSEKLNGNNSNDGYIKKNIDNIWFIKQNIRNSCGTIALLHLHNNLKNKFLLDRGSIADNFFNKVKDMTPDERAKEFENTKSFELLHHEFAGEDLGTEEIVDVDTHFIVFIEIDGHVVELDGRKNEPIIHCLTTPDNFLYDAANIIKKNFIDKCFDDNRFSALAVVSNTN
ncbi:ubiquitin carboxyl-terminal hydrolase, putative [Plasmodium gallinaceum]|uniref:Ubiquitin carboxyl-terminal hydrolase n=1 Tax=Plasmodium gallinaceum TaxID=5849 RepID=A0A1J1GUT0_PLAGA|nr:ubiquitin carboxyl-terminal hydrolase, putative [Plasmodium gallinaceum]CRG94801.1 ubiquitin carboxyl-terminal hydrolase, putative [Plasmodium gallinaceum]